MVVRGLPDDFPPPRTFRPTLEEFVDFEGYIRKLEEQDVHKTGICKIVCPEEWVPRKAGYADDSFDFKIARPVQQKMCPVGEDRGIKGAYQAKSSAFQDTPMTIAEFRKMATSTKYQAPRHIDADDLERKYWRNLRFVPPVYGADVTQSITDGDARGFNSAKLDSILKHIKEDTGKVYYGVNSSYLYFGMWKATFPWHVEDMDFYAINMIHYGEPKTWYCVPPKYGHRLEAVAKELFPQYAALCTSFLRHKIALISPEVLEKHGVPVVKMHHEARSIIVVFPYAYHSGFNHGYNIAESTNFATERWIEYGKRHRPCDCMTATVKVDMTAFVRRFQKDKLEQWQNGTDIAPHPEDPEDVRKRIMERARDPVAYAKKMEDQVFKPPPLHLRYETRHGDWCFVDPIHKEIVRKPFNWDDEEEERYQAWRAAQSDVVCADIYRHIELSHVEVKVDPVTKECLDYKALQFLRARLGKNHIKSFKAMLDCGEMFKADQRMVHKSEIKEKEVKVDPIKAALKETTEEEDDDDDNDKNGNDSDDDKGEKRRRSEPRPRAVPTPKVEVRAEASHEDTEDSDLSSYYSSDDDDGGGDSSDSDDSPRDISSESDFDSDPEYGKKSSGRKRKKLSKKERKRAKRMRRELGFRESRVELDGLSKGLRELVAYMERIRRGEAPVVPKEEEREADKENQPQQQEDLSAAADSLAAGNVKSEVKREPDDQVVPAPPAPVAEVKKEADAEQPSPPVGPIYFDLRSVSKAVAEAREFTLEQIGAITPILYGLEIIRKEDGVEFPVWQGMDWSRNISPLERTLSEPNEVEGESHWWRHARAVIRLFIESKGKYRMSLYRCLESLYFPDRMEEAQHQSENLRTVFNIVVGLGLADLVRRGRWKWRGPNIYDNYCMDLLTKYREDYPRLCWPQLHIQRVPIPEGLKPSNRRKRLFTVYNPTSSKFKYIEQKTKDVDVSTLDDEQKRSLQNHKKVCRCGTKVASSAPGKSRVLTGFKKRSRCKKCDGCLAKKCLACVNCLNPRNKQSCVKKICLFPVVPKCPCFD